MSTEDSNDHVRQTVDNMTSEEVAAVLDQIAALHPAEEPLAMPPQDSPLQRNRAIELPAPPPVVQALTLHVEVELVVPRVWRQVEVRGDLTLEDLHAVIQRAVGWQNYHLHRFWESADQDSWHGSYYLTDGDVAEGEQGTHESEARLDQVYREVGDALRYTYDFGDDWHHLIRLESVDELAADAPRAVCTDGEMAGPLEDAGGPPGYNELVEAFSDDPPLGRLEDYVREWLPDDWDPTVLDLGQVNSAISLIGASTEEVFAVVAGVEPPAAIGALLELARPDVLATLAELCRSAGAVEGRLDDEDLAAIARPYRLLLDLAGTEGIPLTQAGWMKPAVVQEIVAALGLETSWIGKGNREDQTLPVAQLRESAQGLGFLRKRKGRLLLTNKGAALSTDHDYVEAIAAGLLTDRDPYVAAARGLFALLTVAGGHSDLKLAGGVAELMTHYGLRTGPAGVERQHAGDMVWPTWCALDGDMGLGKKAPRADHQAVGLAVAALWPERSAQTDA